MLHLHPCGRGAHSHPKLLGQRTGRGPTRARSEQSFHHQHAATVALSATTRARSARAGNARALSAGALAAAADALAAAAAAAAAAAVAAAELSPGPQAARGLHRSASANALLHAGAADSPGRAMLSPPVQRANTFKASVVRVLRV